MDFTWLLTFIKNAIQWFLDKSKIFLIEFVNWCIEKLAAQIEWLKGQLPQDDPSTYDITGALDAQAFSDFVGYLNWFFPTAAFAESLAWFFTGLLFWIAIRPLLRFFRFA